VSKTAHLGVNLCSNIDGILRKILKKDTILKLSKAVFLLLMPFLASLGCGSPANIQAGCGGGAGIPCANPTPTPLPPPVAIPFNPFVIGTQWDMTNPSGGLTHYEVLPIYHFGCETGELVNLRITKTSTSDYWNPGWPVMVYLNFIMIHDPDGSWRSIGWIVDGAVNATVNVFTPPGARYKPYIMLPGNMNPIRMDTGYLYSSVPGSSYDCTPPNTGGYIASWTSEFTWDGTTLHSHQIEDAIHNDTSEEIWDFNETGMLQVVQTYSSQVPRNPPYVMERIF